MMDTAIMMMESEMKSKKNKRTNYEKATERMNRETAQIGRAHV